MLTLYIIICLLMAIVGATVFLFMKYNMKTNRKLYKGVYEVQLPLPVCAVPSSGFKKGDVIEVLDDNKIKLPGSQEFDLIIRPDSHIVMKINKKRTTKKSKSFTP